MLSGYTLSWYHLTMFTTSTIDFLSKDEIYATLCVWFSVFLNVHFFISVDIGYLDNNCILFTMQICMKSIQFFLNSLMVCAL